MDVLLGRCQFPIPRLASASHIPSRQMRLRHLFTSIVQTGEPLRGRRLEVRAPTRISWDGSSATEVKGDDKVERHVANGDDSEILERQELFNTIAPVYDNLNDWMSLGMHRVWKRMSVSWSGAGVGHHVLDICCGSGDLAFVLAEKVGVEGKVIGIDFAAQQLAIAASRQQDYPRRSSANIQWMQADALNLPFQDGSFDAVTMGYGLRNVTSIPRALMEIYRVLKPGGRAAILDFNRSSDNETYGFQSWMLDNVVVPVATYLGVEQEYKYLKTSIARFPLGAEQESLARDVGFSEAVHHEVGGGLMGVLVVTK